MAQSIGRPDLQERLIAAFGAIQTRKPGISQEAFAEAAGTTQPSISRMLNGDMRFRIDEFAGILELYEVDLIGLFEMFSLDLPECVTAFFESHLARLVEPDERAAIIACAKVGMFDQATPEIVQNHWINMRIQAGRAPAAEH